MKKNTIKLISILAIIMCTIMLTGSCFALDPNDVVADTSDSSGLGDIANGIATVVRNVGVIVAVVMLMVIGIKYMMGSAEEKAEYKKVMLPYFIGAILLFAAAGVAQVVISMSETITGD